MTKLVKDGRLQADEWKLLGKGEEFPQRAIENGEKLLLPLALWAENASSLTGNPDVGVWLDSDDSVDRLGEFCGSLRIIAINFPSFADGRGYSLARQLRDKLGYEGELRAIGDVLRDQAFFYQRVGFSSFKPREDRPAEGAIEALRDFSVVYQAAADDRPPAHNQRQS